MTALLSDRRLSDRRLWWRLVCAIAGGLLLGLAWQPYAVWGAILIGIPLLLIAVHGQRARRAFGLGYAFGLALLTVTIGWIEVLGTWIAALLILFEALFFGLLGVALALVSKLRLWPLWSAFAWTALEFAYSRVPFGGFGWVRLAYAAVDTPLAGFLPLIGVPGVSLLVALAASVFGWLVLRALREHRPRAEWRSFLHAQRRPAVAVLIGFLVVGATGAMFRGLQFEPAAGTGEPLAVGVVQGNVPGRGMDAMGEARSVTNNHLSQTIELTARWRLGQVPEPDFILWPENSTDIDPVLDATTRQVVDSATKVAGKPILVGAVMQGPGPDERQTTGLWWDPQQGILGRYDKRNLVPFGEWIPFRAQLLPLVPILEEVGPQAIPGTRPGVMTIPIGDRIITVGDAVCFELAYDQTIYDTITNGAQVSMVQSNNATYGGTGQIEQQFAITRARAMETRREIAVATTNSVSGFIDRDGNVVRRTQEFTADSFVVEMPVRSAITPAVLIAPWLDRAMALIGLLAAVVGGVGVARFGRLRKTGESPAREPAHT
ncbi:apolipoprotein N-acyltransferase [Microlunatus parietis]|uniref:Apolipoprotein N-acyltransferase n=1 Tax=Microlunatus parietis TaxID=682979 RepID=A0A7Y9IET5_9ACTN|nr:apolipoprotein N-acyltransferase [Microlunatus parietis]NYE75618.1 apolipoprotein N-acyltransferase [Microlunatus parietis]